jgi:group I intron endonuclease
MYGGAMHYLYIIRNVLNNKVYVGQTTNLKRRWQAHRSYSKQKIPTQYIHRAMNKYGIDNFIQEHVASCRTQEDADVIETFLINQYDSRNKENGYNLAPGGNVAWPSGLPSHMYPRYGKHHTEEHKQYMSNLFKGRVLAPPVTEETRQKMSESRMGHETSKETRQKISIANTDKAPTLEIRKKMSDVRIGKPLSLEIRSNMSLSSKGKKKSEEHRKNISLAKIGENNPMFGKKQSEERIQKTRQAQLGEKSHFAKLSVVNVDYIKEMLKTNEKGIVAKLAKSFGISKKTIYNIKNEKTWQ